MSEVKQVGGKTAIALSTYFIIHTSFLYDTFIALRLTQDKNL